MYTFSKEEKKNLAYFWNIKDIPLYSSLLSNSQYATVERGLHLKLENWSVKPSSSSSHLSEDYPASSVLSFHISHYSNGESKYKCKA
jgi:hypothetical protein